MTKYAVSLSLTLLFTLCGTSLTFGQFGGMGGGLTREREEVKIFHLETITPADAVKALTQIMTDLDPDTEPSVRFAVQPTTKSLIAKGTAEDLKIVQTFLMSVDPHPAQDPPNKKFVQKLFPITLKHADPNALLSAINNVGLPFQTYSDYRTNKLLVYGPEIEFGRVTELIEVLDVPMMGVQDKDVRNNVMIRFVWLAETALSEEHARKVPADLTGPIDALRQKIGLGELRTASQILVQASTSSASTDSFKASGTAELKHAYSIQFSGTIGAGSGPDQYQLQVHISTQDLADGGAGPTELTTQCAGIRPGQPVILGTTPINSHSSVFVVQILEK